MLLYASRIGPGVALALILLTCACGGTPPPPERGVVEDHLGTWRFRRYQQVQEIEVWIKDNPGVAHTASYLRADAEKQGRIADGDLINVFVTRYQKDTGILRASIVFARRLAQDGGYQVEEEKRGGVQVLTIAGHDESWVMWPTKHHVVKLGGRYLAKVPADLVKAYGKRYPSQLSGGMLDGPLPADPAEKLDPDKGEEYDPDNPQPDWKKFKGKIKTPKGDRDK